MSTRIIDELEAKKIIGISIRTSNDEALHTIPPFWQKFYQENILEKIPNKISNNIIAVYTDFENAGKNNQGKYSMIIGAEVNDLQNVPPQFVSTIIPPSKRAVFNVAHGQPEKVGEKWMEIWQRHDLKKTFISEYEEYKTSGEINIFIGIA